MTSLLIIIVLVLLAISLTKIFDLTQVGSDLDDSQVASDDDNNFQGYFNAFFSLIYILQFMDCIHGSSRSSYSCVRARC
jgi:cytochrome c oxidase subunit 2